MSTSIARVGILSPVTEAGMKDWWNKLKEGLEELGYVEGRNIEFVWRFGDGKFERLPDLASELAKLRVDVICRQHHLRFMPRNRHRAPSPLSFRLVQIQSRPASSPTWNAPVGTSPGWQPCRGCKVSRDWLSFANACPTQGALP